mmetsp:Transcript_80672/g.216215  ORF Transcript_80672/g.216215 Transcript_80672/m.216215 type:complete len:662 (-) Transcript_80672:2-1987(-)
MGLPVLGECRKKNEIMAHKVAILDAGAQYGKLIDRRVRELNVESDVLPLNTPPEKLKGVYGAIIISGGPGSCYAADAPEFNPAVLEMGLPVLGVCYGYQVLNFVKGGSVERADKREDRQEFIEIETSSRLFAGLSARERVLLTHGDAVTKLAPGFRVIGSVDGLTVALENEEKRMYGTQFHPEVDLSDNGVKIFSNFLFGIAGLEANFTGANRHQAALKEIRDVVGDKEILVLVSGGVDSSVCAALCREAVGAERVHAVHIDHGFMRHEESETVCTALGKVGLDLRVVNCAADFAAATTTVKGKDGSERVVGPLAESISPEDKRMIIGDTFMRITEREVTAMKIDPNKVFLAQGTLRPDLIESGSHLASAKADVIKTHHNDTALVRQLRQEGKIVEPLRDYHKDEVRRLGEELGLPHHLVWRQPFPGPGLAIRVLCSDGTCPAAPGADEMAKVREVVAAGYTKAKLSVACLPVRTVGVQGDCRSYKAAVALSLPAPDPADPASAVAAVDWPALFAIARRVPSEAPSVSRTVLMFGAPVDSEKDAAALTAVTPTCCVKEVLDQLRAADRVGTETMLRHGLEHTISQMPVVLFPASFGQPGARSIALRPFITRDFMTGTPAVPGQDMPLAAVEEMVRGILAVPGIARVVFDLTAKPPGTTEWE